jgi:hypothetical protein
MVDETALAAAVMEGVKEAGGAAFTPSPEPATPDGGTNDDQDASNQAPQSDGAQADDADSGNGNEADTAGAGGESDAGAAGEGGDASGEADPVEPGEGDAEADPGKAGDAGKKGDPTDPVTSDAKKEGEDGFDALLDTPLPNALKPATKERIRGLVTRVKEVEQKAQQSHSNFDQLYTAIEETGATPQEYADSLTVLRLLKSGDRQSMESALQIKLAEVADLSKVLGVAVPGVNLLEGFQDLIDEVGAGKLTLQRANEIAASRHSAQRASQRSETAGQQSREQQQRRAAINNGIQGLNALGQKLAADPDFARKSAIVKEQLKPVFKNIHPSQWVTTFERAYRALPSQPAAAKAAVRPAGGTVPKNQPVRGGGPAGGQVKAPSSIEEAVRAGLKAAGT